MEDDNQMHETGTQDEKLTGEEVPSTSSVPKHDSGISLSNTSESCRSDEKGIGDSVSTGSASSSGSSSTAQKTKKSDSGFEKDDDVEDGPRQKRKKKRVSSGAIGTMVAEMHGDETIGEDGEGGSTAAGTSQTRDDEELSSPEPPRDRGDTVDLTVPIEGMAMRVRIATSRDQRTRRNYRPRNSDDDEDLDSAEPDPESSQPAAGQRSRAPSISSASSTASMPPLVSDHSGTSDDSSDESVPGLIAAPGGSGTGRGSHRQQRRPPLPLPTWYAVRSLAAREQGFGPRHDPIGFPLAASRSIGLVQRLEKAHCLEFHTGCVNTLHFNQAGTLLASGSDDLKIAIWDWTLPGGNVDGAPLFSYASGHRGNVFQAKFMPMCNDSSLVSCARDGDVRLSTLSSAGSCTQTKKVAHHKGSAHKLALEPESPHVFLTAGEDAVVFSIDLRDDKPNKILTCRPGENDTRAKCALYSIHTNPREVNQFAVGGRCHWARIYDKRMIREKEKSSEMKRFCPGHLKGGDHSPNITCLTYNYNGTELLCSYNDEDIYLFDATHSTEAEHIHVYKGHRNSATVKGVNFYGPRSEVVVSGSDCGNIFLWERSSERIVKYMHGDQGGVVNVLEPHPYYPVLATSGLDPDAKIWMPTAQGVGADLTGLHKLTNRNKRERDNERSSPAYVDDHVFVYLMNHIRQQRARRRRAQGGGGDNEDSDSDEVSDDSNAQVALSDDTDESDAERPSCVPS